MEFVEAILRQYDIYIIMGLAALSILLAILVVIDSARISKLSKKYRKFMRGSKDKNLEEVLVDFMSKVDRVEEKSDKIKSLYDSIDNRLKNCVQKVSIIRYKAFEDMGGAALSFSIALLDANDDGIILTGIYGRNECTTYAKPVDKGIPKYDLSDEEKTALQEAIKKKLL